MIKHLTLAKIITAGLMLSACASQADYFEPKSEYPNDPWVKGYSDPDDCLGGEKLAARRFFLPEYPTRAYNSGWQGWVIIRLDVTAEGLTENVRVERSVPVGRFDKTAKSAVRDWEFEPPEDGRLDNCRVLIRFKLGAVSLGG